MKTEPGRLKRHERPGRARVAETGGIFVPELDNILPGRDDLLGEPLVARREARGSAFQPFTAAIEG